MDNSEAVAERPDEVEAEPEETEPQAVGPDEAEHESAELESTPDGRCRLPILLIAAAVLFAGAGTWLLIDAHALRSSASARNGALVDPAATAEVTASVSNSLNKIFSYSYDKTGVTEQAAAGVLRGPALDSYSQLFAQVRELAPQQKLVLTTRVVSSAVQYFDAGHARLLVFLDQSATRADNNSTSASAAQLSITVKREGEVWVITDLVPR